MASSWEPTAVKALLRLTAQRLGQLQEKKDSKGTITRRDVATLLQQGNVGLARAKAQNLIQEDALGDLLEVLELHVGLILEHLHEIDQNASPTPVVVEAASSIIYAAPHTESKELNIVRDLLIQRLGPDFARSAIGNRDNHVSSRVIRALSAPPPSAAKLDDLLVRISRAYGVKWVPEPRRQDILIPLSELLDPETSPVVDLPRLRRICVHGVPDEPAWLRPRIWKLFFGILPVLKSSWATELGKQRASYYDLIRRLLQPFSDLPPPTTPFGALDVALLKVSKQLSRIPPSLFVGLEDEPELSALCPLDEIATDDIKILCASNLDTRLKNIRDHNTNPGSTPQITPEIRLESDNEGTPEISLSTPESLSARRKNVPTTLVASKTYNGWNTHEKHSSALLRLLYLHSCINPGNHSPHIPSLLVPLYSVLCQEIEPQDVAHAEADTFWLFEAVIGEFSELEDEEGGNLWMKKLSERLEWADAELSESLHAKGLDPALPHYSYRWLAPLLTQTLPLSSVYVVWDALFSREMRKRDINPKLDCLIDVCTGMLIRARTALFRLGKAGQRSPGLWVEDNDGIPPPSPIRAWELGDAFLEGMSLLQMYPVEAAGGIDRLLQTASDLARRREEETKVVQSDNRSLGARLKVSMWKGFTNQSSSPDRSPVESEEESSEEEEDSHDDGNDTETPEKPTGIGSRLATTVWRGITNQSSMEPPPSPLLPLSPATSRSSSPAPPNPTVHVSDASPLSSPSLQPPSGIWGYAEKLKDSDAAATFAKVSSNWRAKALLGSWGGLGAAQNIPASASDTMAEPSTSRYDHEQNYEGRRGSLPPMDRTGVYSPPARPAFFRPPRDSMLPQPRRDGPITSPTSPDSSPQSEGGFLSKTKNLQASLASLTGLQTPAKTGPRPLLLNSSSLMTAPLPNPRLSRSVNSTPVPSDEQWANVMRAKGHRLHTESQSSISSLSPSDALGLGRPMQFGTRSDSDTSGPSRAVPSRVVPLNRRSISPMAPLPRVRPTSGSSATSSDRGTLSPPMATKTLRGWTRVETPDSPSTGSPIIPETPLSMANTNGTVRVTNPESQRGSLVLTDSNVSPLEPPLQSRKIARKKTPSPVQYQTDEASDSSASQALPRSPRRSKRHGTKPAHLNIREAQRSQMIAEQKLASPNSLGVEWPEDADIATTPKATSFDMGSTSPVSPRSPRRRKASADGPEGRLRKISTDGHEGRIRKTSEGRSRKVSGENKESTRRTRDSAAEEGDDEGYDDLLSAYESEEGQKSFSDSLR